MHRFRTLTLSMSLLILTFALPAGSALGQAAQAVSPWQWGSGGMKVSECKESAENFLEAKGFVVTKVTSQGANETEANAEAVSKEFFVLVDCRNSQRTRVSVLVVVVGRNASAAEQAEQLRKDVMKAVVK
jgi:hypothetical protein